jgi:hypothetical protein
MIEYTTYLIVGRCNNLGDSIDRIAKRFIPDVDYTDDSWIEELLDFFKSNEALDMFYELEPELFSKYEHSLNEVSFNIIGDLDNNVFGIGTSVPIDMDDYKLFIKTMRKVYQNLFQDDQPLQLFTALRGIL